MLKIVIISKRIHNTMVLDSRCNYLPERHKPLDCPVVTLGSAAGKENLLGGGSDTFGNGSTCISQSLFADLLKEYKLDGLPYSSVRNGIMASRASGASLVVAALSA